jgi:hypothetical protein
MMDQQAISPKEVTPITLNDDEEDDYDDDGDEKDEPAPNVRNKGRPDGRRK